MQITNRQEELSRAYLHAVAAAVGCTVAEPRPDIDSIDCTLSTRLKGKIYDTPKIDVQLKCTQVNESTIDGSIRFPLKKKNYDDLRRRSSTPHILLVLLVPKELDDWILTSHGELTVKFAAYWCSLKGSPDSSNSKTVTINIPRTNLFDGTALKELMKRAADGDITL